MIICEEFKEGSMIVYNVFILCMIKIILWIPKSKALAKSKQCIEGKDKKATCSLKYYYKVTAQREG